MRSRSARTGAPASASTALVPTVRSSVLFPDMFDPLTSSIRESAPQMHGVGDGPRRGEQRVGDAVALEAGALVHEHRERIGRGARRRSPAMRAQGLELAEPVAAIRPGAGPKRAASARSRTRPARPTAATPPAVRTSGSGASSAGRSGAAAARCGGTAAAPAVLNLSTMCRSRGALNASRSNRAKTPASSARSWPGLRRPREWREPGAARRAKRGPRRPRPARTAAVPRRRAPRR